MFIYGHHLIFSLFYQELFRRAYKEQGYQVDTEVADYIYDWDVYESGTGVRRYRYTSQFLIFVDRGSTRFLFNQIYRNWECVCRRYRS